MSPVLELVGAGKVYPGTPPVRSLHDVDLTVHVENWWPWSGLRGPARPPW